MSYQRNRRLRPPTRREQIDSNNAWHRFYAAASDNPDAAAAVERDLIVTQKPKRVRRPVDGRAVVPTEHEEQATVISWWWHKHKEYGVPHFALFAVPNGGMRDYIVGARLKSEGMRKGSSDLILDCPRGAYHGLRIEMKRQGATESAKTDEQKEFGDYLTSAGYRFQFCSGADEAIAAITEYMT